ncbi:hypothetical protein SD915_06495, partial [Lactobacillus crispatus]|uniref:hypothetical protein n=1 Tax=Lactobacillus crispatus TaxID=47770 RepID=UPI0029C55D70
RSRFLKKEILIVFIHLEASFFPDTFSFTDFYFSVFLLQKERSILPNSYDQDSVELIAQFYR